MELFKNLGAEIEAVWRDKNYDETVFPAIASDALEKASLPEKVSAWEVIEWALGETILPEQRDLAGNFGDPPITVYNSPRFHIDVYFWLQGTTALHQHAFCGAFQVMHGSSIHSHYEFEPRERINTFTEIGDMNLKTVELLEVGKVRKILAGREYIHGLFHLEQPSATIVVRTHRSPLHLPQYAYHKPYLAIDPFFDEPNTTKKLQCVTALIRTKHPDTARLVTEFLEASDFQTSFKILSSVKNLLQKNQIDEIFNLNASQNQFDAFLEVVERRHGERAKVLREVFAHQEIIEEILKRRSYVTEPEQRFFLALLMNVEGRERIFALIKERFPDSEPIDKILDWTYDLSQARVVGTNLPNALGIADFGDFDLFVLECLLKGMSEAEMRETLQTEYPPENVENLMQSAAEKIGRIRQSVIFQPLLAAETPKKDEGSD